jgi:hypothetical protein
MENTMNSDFINYGNGALMKSYLKKMKENEEIQYNNLPKQMKPTYHTNVEMNCGVARCNGKDYLMDHTDKDAILNFHKKFSMHSPTDVYPSYGENSKRIYYLDFLYKYNTEHNCYVFKNGNELDLRRCNVVVYPKYMNNLLEGYTILETLNGHCKHVGTDSGVIKNPMWKVQDETGEYYIMYCEPGILVKLCQDSCYKIREFEMTHNEGEYITWYLHLNNYIQGRIGKMRKHIFIHQVIMDCYGNGKGTGNISVDHIDRNPHNNKLSNLRIATREEQQNNTKGIAPGTLRARSAKKELPEGLTYDMLHKFVYYNFEVYNKEENTTREFFRVEHPKLQKHWCTTKSGKVSILEKLAQANKVSDDLERDIFPKNIAKSVTITTGGAGEGGGGRGATKATFEDVSQEEEGKETIKLPKYVVFTIAREKPHLVFDKKTENGRFNLKMVLPSKEYIMSEQLEKLNKKIVDKYGEEHKVL